MNIEKCYLILIKQNWFIFLKRLWNVIVWIYRIDWQNKWILNLSPLIPSFRGLVVVPPFATETNWRSPTIIVKIKFTSPMYAVFYSSNTSLINLKLPIVSKVHYNTYQHNQECQVIPLLLHLSELFWRYQNHTVWCLCWGLL